MFTLHTYPVLLGNNKRHASITSEPIFSASSEPMTETQTADESPWLHTECHACPYHHQHRVGGSRSGLPGKMFIILMIITDTMDGRGSWETSSPRLFTKDKIVIHFFIGFLVLRLWSIMWWLLFLFKCCINPYFYFLKVNSLIFQLWKSL